MRLPPRPPYLLDALAQWQDQWQADAVRHPRIGPCRGRLAVRYEHEWCDEEGRWYRSSGTEIWEFDRRGRIIRRCVSLHHAPISGQERGSSRGSMSPPTSPSTAELPPDPWLPRPGR
jgi:nuclear transport factor 2 (NTF2) superfamily protein